MNTMLEGEKGLILPLSLIIGSFITLIILSYSLVVLNNMRMAAKAADSIRAYYVADAGLANAYMQLRVATNPGAQFSVTGNNYPVGPGSMTGSYQVTVVRAASPGTLYNITSTGSYKGITKTMVFQVNMISFCKWNYLSNTEISPVWGTLWFITGMTTTGEVHSNGQFNMYGTPIFTGAVSQHAATINYYHGGPPLDNPDFRGGLTLSAPTVAVTTATVIDPIKSSAQQPQGLYLTGNSRATFLSNGTMNVTNAVKGWVNVNMAMPANQAIFVTGGNATVQGTVKGQVTVGCDKDIIIGGNLLYNTDPRTTPSSTDVVGLVAQNNIKVTDSGPFNIEIDAYLVAITGDFEVMNFWNFLKGDMVQFGGLMNSYCGATGAFNPYTGQMVMGYNQLMYYDNRFAQNFSPPYFPPVLDGSGRSTYDRVKLTEV